MPAARRVQRGRGGLDADAIGVGLDHRAAGRRRRAPGERAPVVGERRQVDGEHAGGLGRRGRSGRGHLVNRPQNPTRRKPPPPRSGARIDESSFVACDCGGGMAGAARGRRWGWRLGSVRARRPCRNRPALPAAAPIPAPAVGLHDPLVSAAAVFGRVAHQRDMPAKCHADETQSPEGPERSDGAASWPLDGGSSAWPPSKFPIRTTALPRRAKRRLTRRPHREAIRRASRSLGCFASLAMTSRSWPPARKSACPTGRNANPGRRAARAGRARQARAASGGRVAPRGAPRSLTRAPGPGLMPACPFGERRGRNGRGAHQKDMLAKSSRRRDAVTRRAGA